MFIPYTIIFILGIISILAFINSVVQHYNLFRFNSKGSIDNYYKDLIDWKLLNTLQYISTPLEDSGKSIDIYVCIWSKHYYYELYNLAENKFYTNTYLSDQEIFSRYRENGLCYCVKISDGQIYKSAWGEKFSN